VVGGASLPDESVHAFLWLRGRMRDLGTLGGPWSLAYSVNHAGAIAGASQIAAGPGDAFFCGQVQLGDDSHICRAAFWDGTGVRDLGTLGGANSYAVSINDRNEITGGAQTSDSRHAFIWRNGTMIDLGTPVGFDGDGRAINNRGQVAVEAHISNVIDPTWRQPDYHGFIWDRGRYTDIGTLGGTVSDIFGINQAGHVVGYSSLTGDAAVHGIMWREGALVDLGVLPGDFVSGAQAVNDSDTVIGVSLGNDLHFFVWKNGQMSDLNSLIPPDSGWQLLLVNDINNRGQIVGAGLHNGDFRAFLLSPIKSQSN